MTYIPGGGGGGVSSVSGTAPMTSTGGSTPAIGLGALGVTDAHVATANKDGAAGTASLRTLGGGAAQAAAGNDARLSDARTPTSHAASHNSGGGDALAADAAAGTPSLRSLGTTSVKACPGNDARLSDARAPTAHASTHQPGGSDAMAVDAAAATGSLRTLGSGAAQACPGGDSRLSDARTPTVHASTHLPGGTDPVVPLPVDEYALTASQTIGSTQKALLWGTLTISSGTLTVNGKLLVMAEPYGV